MSTTQQGPLPPALSWRDQAILDFEAAGTWSTTWAKEAAIRERFKLQPHEHSLASAQYRERGDQVPMSSTRYHQILNALLDEPAAMAYAPVLVARLRRVRDRRRRARSTRRLDA